MSGHTVGIKTKFTYCTVCLKTMSDICLVNCNYTMHRSVITVLICYAQ